MMQVYLDMLDGLQDQIERDYARRTLTFLLNTSTIKMMKILKRERVVTTKKLEEAGFTYKTIQKVTTRLEEIGLIKTKLVNFGKKGGRYRIYHIVDLSAMDVAAEMLKAERELEQEASRRLQEARDNRLMMLLMEECRRKAAGRMTTLEYKEYLHRVYVSRERISETQAQELVDFFDSLRNTK